MRNLIRSSFCEGVRSPGLLERSVAVTAVLPKKPVPLTVRGLFVSQRHHRIHPGGA